MQFKILIFSKNRACQLDLLLRSLSIPAKVLYSYDADFEAGYKKLMSLHPHFEFVYQTDFKTQLISEIATTDFILFLTDDDVMIDSLDPNYPEIAQFSIDPTIASLSLGLSPQVAGKKWQWANYRNNRRLRMWGYPMSVDSCIFRSGDILPTIQKCQIKNPNYLETELNKHIPNRPFMACFDQLKIINNSVNQVQVDFPAHTRGPQASDLEKLFLMGQRIALEPLIQRAKDLSHYRIQEEYQFETA